MRKLSVVIVAVVIVAVVNVSTLKYVSASARLDASRDALVQARAAVAVTRDTRDEQLALRDRAVKRARRLRAEIAGAVRIRRDTEVQIAEARLQLATMTALVENAAIALITTAGYSNDARACLDGVTRATVSLSSGDDQGALDALNEFADACARTLVADDATVACAQDGLSSSRALQEFFARRSDLWAGADLTDVVPLPDGRTLWLFGDTVYADVESDGSRGELESFGNNSAFVQSGGCMRHISSNGSQRSWLSPPQTGQAYWPAGGVVVDDTLSVFLGRVIPSPPFGQLLGRAVAELSLPDLGLRGITPSPLGPADIGWGTAAIAPGDGSVYIYGTRRPDCETCWASDAFVARAPAGSVSTIESWTFFDGASWSPDVGAAKPIISGAGTRLSVRPFRGGWLAVAKAADIITNDIVAWWAPSPVGPWTATGSIYQTPTFAPNAYTYMPSIVSSDGSTIVLAYNVGSLSEAESAANAALYGPRFVKLEVPSLPGMS